MTPRRTTPLLVLALVCLHCGGEHSASEGSASKPSQTSSGASAPPSATQQTSAPPAASASVAASAASAPAMPSRPLYYEGAIKKEDLEDRTLRELILMRNWIYARAGNTFRKPWLDEFFRAQAWYQPSEKMDEKKISARDKENARAIVDFEAALGQPDLEKRRDEVLARKKAGTATTEDDIELSLLSQRLGTWLGDTGGAVAATPLSDPSKLDQLLSMDDLNTLSRRDLRMLRNTIYARRGRPFDSEVVKSYFKAAAWYKPNAGYSDSLLTEIDRKNIAIVRSVELSVGGPDHENPDFPKEGWVWQA